MELMLTPSEEAAVQEAVGLMLRFAERTGLTSDRPVRRYLWTDAFAVCNFLGLARATGEKRYQELALRLVDQVHQVLGRHRPDDPRTGWISGLDEQQGQRHPTRGGLRIGKELPERPAGAPLDEVLEWERDGQYFHYLTQWMMALDRVSRATGQGHFNVWARELAYVAHKAFTMGTAGQDRRMVWKMSIDLSRPLVPFMGHHDPLEGLVTALQLQTTAEALSITPDGPDLEEEVADYAAMVEGRDWKTADPLGLGGLLVDAWRVGQLMQQGVIEDSELLDTLLQAALEGLSLYARHNELQQPASLRLAFRELGLAIGLLALERLSREGLSHPQAEELPYRELGSMLVSFWRKSRNQQNQTWREHCNINEVMLATCLVPGGLLDG